LACTDRLIRGACPDKCSACPDKCPRTTKARTRRRRSGGPTERAQRLEGGTGPRRNHDVEHLDDRHEVGAAHLDRVRYHRDGARLGGQVDVERVERSGEREGNQEGVGPRHRSAFGSERRFHEVQGSPTDRETCCNPRKRLSGHAQAFGQSGVPFGLQQDQKALLDLWRSGVSTPRANAMLHGDQACAIDSSNVKLRWLKYRGVRIADLPMRAGSGSRTLLLDSVPMRYRVASDGYRTLLT
jgi:hypothetical protein